MESHDTLRLLSNLIRTGTVRAVDVDARACRVDSGDLATTWIPWIVGRAGRTASASAPTVGEQVMLFCPEGEIANAIALCGLYSDAFPGPAATSSQDVLVFADGAMIRYDAATHLLEALLPDAGSAVITAQGGITLNGPLTVNGTATINGDTSVVGDVAITGTATADVDVVGGGKSLKGHRHVGVQAGGSTSGPPQ